MTDARTASAPPRPLARRLADGEVRAALTFAGQGADPLEELATLVAQNPALRDGARRAGDVLQEAAASPLGEASGQFRHGLDVASWIDDPDGAPPAAYLRGAGVSYPLILLSQALLWRSLWSEGLGEALAAGTVVAVSGHSQGLLAALMVAEAPDGEVDDDLLARHLLHAWAQGLHMATARVDRSGGSDATCMAAVTGVRLRRLEALVADVDAGLATGSGVSIALVNGPARAVVGGAASGLAALRARLEAVARDEEDARRRGERGGAPLRAAWTPLPLDVPFHTPHLAAARERFSAWEGSRDGLPAAGALRLAVLDPATGADLRDSADAAGDVIAGQFTTPVRWDRVTRALARRGADWVLDLGPGTAVARMTGEGLRGSGARALALASPEGRRVLTVPGAAPEGPDVRWADHAPGLVETPDGRRHLDGRYTRMIGRPPVILAGMTPTTSDAGIVAAAANAGYTAELAGGGQPDRATFTRRVEELRTLLDPGREAVFNTLLLDRHLWSLHWADDALLLEARRAGAPLCGLTVSAGVPEVDEALEIIERLHAHGMPLVTFKPGTPDQVRRVLAIADAAPHRTITMHLEGGRSGGHHSWEDLDELLLDGYADIRRRANVVLCVGGGVGAPGRAADLLTGAWSAVHDEPPMPVDAVLVGTAAMACAEATASPQVKRALVAAAGSADWVPRRAVGGGVTSARSNLNADIHLIDNSAARAGHLLEEVAGDATAVAARRDEIVAALARTAKPYLGDLEAMTYLELLRRYTDRCAIGRGRPGDDGAWGHPSWRDRALELYRRAAARLAVAEEGPVVAPVAAATDLDDPQGALAALAAALPAAATTLLHPADAVFALEVFDRPGKPVPFVPVLDAEVRRWFMADGLWQAQDERYEADAVFVIPGPAAVGGIARADEPVADLLRRVEMGAIARLEAAGAPVARRERLGDPGPVPAPLAAAVAGRHGPIAALCASPSVVEDGADGRRTRPNPLWRLVLPGDDVDVAADDGGRIIHLTAVPRGSADERVVVEADGRDVVVTAWVSALDPPAERFVIRGRPIAGSSGAFIEVEGARARADMARRALTGAAPAPVGDPADGAESAWTLTPGLAGAYRAATGAEHDGVPLDLALTLAWPALAGLLGVPEVASRLTELVHGAHAVRPGPAWPPREGEGGRVRAHLGELDDPAGRITRLSCSATLTCARGVLAEIDADLLVLGAEPVTGAERRMRRAIDRVITPAGPAERALLADQDWVRAVRPLPAAGPLRVRADAGMEQPRGGAPRWWARGVIEAGGEVVAEIALDRTGPGRAHPVPAVLDLVAGPDPAVTPRPRRELARDEDAAPGSMAAFARVGGDHNPLHRSTLVARLAGREAPIVHGAWTAARAGALVADRLCGGDVTALRDWRVRFTAPVELGAPLDLAAARVGVRDGRRVIDVRVSSGDVVVATATAEVAPPPTALVFPGQGVQRQGLGADGRGRSRAARAAWDAADAATRERLGISILDVVERNPVALRTAGGEVVSHPAGVLNRTELTQVALVAHATAGIAELREAGVLGDVAVAAGHSVGEVSALVALGAIAPADALELVHRRGLAMQACVPRDAAGASPYRLAVVDPQEAGTDLDGLTAAVAAVAAELGQPLEVVNHNAPGRQYAVAGTARGIAALGARLRRGGRAAVRELRGVDVPFHSSVLAPAVAVYRADVERLVGGVDAALLAGRWVPNLVGRPFALDDAFAEAVAAAAGGDVAAPGPGRARELLVALLSAQIAAPVRWTDTQRALITPRAEGGLGVRRVVEVGPAHAPVLTDLGRMALASRPVAGPPPDLLHCELDRAIVRDEDLPPEDEAPPPPDVPAAPVAPAAAVPSPAAGVAPATADRPIDAGDALRLVLALQARVRPDQLDESESIDDLFQGVSSRRNQVLIDLGREFGLSGGEGAQSGTIGDLVTALRDRGSAYRYPGPYLADAMAAGLTRALGGSGLTAAQARGHVAASWGIGPGQVERVLAALVLGTRPGPSARGGDLGPLAGEAPRDAAAARALTDRAAAALGLAPAAPVPGATDPAVAAAGAAEAGEVRAALLDSARALAGALGEPVAQGTPHTEADADLARLAVLDAELGAGRARAVAPAFDPRRHVRFASAWASARWDLVTLFHDALAGRVDGPAVRAEADRLALHGDEPAVASTACWLAGRARARGRGDVGQALDGVAAARRTPLVPEGRPDALLAALAADPAGGPLRPGDPGVAADLGAALAASLRAAPDLRGETALITGAGPGSIGEALARRLLRAGARVVVTTSADTPERRRRYRDLYRADAGPDAELHVVRANLASFADIDALCAWLASPGGRDGRPELRPDPLTPTILVPFAAAPSAGGLDGAGPAFEASLRLQVVGVERLVARVAEAGDPRRPVAVVVPLSPNRGAFGGDGAYGESKAALEALVARWRSEPAWGARTALLAPRIGWVRGTGLMAAADPAADALEADLGVRTFTADEMAWVIEGLLDPTLRARARTAPLALDASGGLGDVADLRAALGPAIARLSEGDGTRARRRTLDAALAERLGGDAPAGPRHVEAVPAPGTDTAPAAWSPAMPAHALDPADMVVIVGAGELGPGGTGRTRFELEAGEPLSPSAVAELAVLCGLVRFTVDGYRGRWIDASDGGEVPEAGLAERYRDAVRARLGVRPLEDDGVVDPAGLAVLAPAVLDRELVTEVASEEEALTHVAADPAHAEARLGDDGRWRAVRRAGATVRLPRTVGYSRRVAGQLPAGLDPRRLGVPAELVAGADRMAVVNMASTIEAFWEAGLTPEELMGAVHPALVANTQGCGMGGMASLRRLLLDHLLDRERSPDRLQESLGNVVAAHVAQSFVGSYGPMVHPVAACATAAVSLEEAHDRIRSGKAVAVLAGGFDDLTPEGLVGFGDMRASVDSDELEAMGLTAAEASRANDERRLGFVEAQGGGALLVVRGDVALALGLPVRGVLAYAGSFGDGVHNSIPASGMGLLAAAMGGTGSPLARALGRLGLGADDIAVVSKHDTSTPMNDPNEADLHERVQTAIGRTPGNPLLVVSQKAVTGHAKGGAAAWQVDGVLRMMESGLVPGNTNLDSADPLLRGATHLALGDRPVRLAPSEPLRCALVASLGFGHVSALLAIAHPDAFTAAVPEAERAGYLARAARRRAEGAQRRLRAWIGRPEPARRSDRRVGDLDPAAAREAEAAMLLDPSARLRDGVYRPA